MNDQLHKTLTQLHNQLGQLDTIEPKEREELEQAVAEIQASLNQSDVDSSDLAKQLHESTERFIDEHPVLAQTAGQIADMLSQMGI